MTQDSGGLQDTDHLDSALPELPWATKLAFGAVAMVMAAAAVAALVPQTLRVRSSETELAALDSSGRALELSPAVPPTPAARNLQDLPSTREASSRDLTGSVQDSFNGRFQRGALRFSDTDLPSPRQ